jgi:hypothetical protein
MEFICSICNKNYKSYQSLWNHTYKKHKFNNTQNSSKSLSNTSVKPPEKNQDKLTCENCKKVFSRSDNLKRHKVKCVNNSIDKI